jgi:hypothetical protein
MLILYRHSAFGCLLAIFVFILYRYGTVGCPQALLVLILYRYSAVGCPLRGGSTEKQKPTYTKITGTVYRY